MGQSVVLLSVLVLFLFIIFINRIFKFSFSINNSYFLLIALTTSVLLSRDLFAQSDTVVAYDAKAHKIIRYYSVPFDTSKRFDNTSYNYGTESGFTELNLTKPLNTPPKSGFTDIVPAHQYFSVTDFPARTSVKIFRFVGDSLAQRCSGTLIGRNLVLTAEHCLCELDTLNRDGSYIYLDSLYVIAAFDNKKPQGDFGGSVSKKYYILKNGFKSFSGYDIAIMELDNPIGDKAGWMGIGYSKDDSFFKSNVFHKFSYPGSHRLDDTTRIYDGDTLYYNYGTLDLVDKDGLGYGLTGIPGQSGSALFYTDNKVYYTFGVLNFANESRHKRIDSKIFYSFRSIIDPWTAVETDKYLPAASDYRLFNAYPNPFNPSTTISYLIPKQSHVELKIIDMLGREVSTLVNDEQKPGEYKIQFNGSSLPSGVYIYTLQAGQFRHSKKLLLIK